VAAQRDCIEADMFDYTNWSIDRSRLRFRDERDWKQVHDPKDVASLSLSLAKWRNVGDMQWRNGEELKSICANTRASGQELVECTGTGSAGAGE